MVAYIFEPILTRGEKLGMLPTLKKSSRTWFRDQAAKTTITPTNLIQSDRSRFRTFPRIGGMYLFSYDPKLKNTLPYYDRFPLVFPIGTNQADGFYGLNMHYLPPILRAKLMDELYKYVSNNKLDETTKLQISYKLLKKISSLRFFRPCLKKYLFSHLRSKFFYIEPKEWDMALFLPLDRFIKTTRAAVYKHSKESIV